MELLFQSGNPVWLYKHTAAFFTSRLLYPFALAAPTSLQTTNMAPKKVCIIGSGNW